MDNIIKKQIQMVHPEKMYPYLKGFTEANLAALFGITAEEYISVKSDYLIEVNIASEELMADPIFLQHLQLVSFTENESIMAIGESTTDDWLSWFELLKNCIREILPAKNINLHNAAVSGQTTSMALRKITADLQAKPTLVICMLGLNDMLRIGERTYKTQVSLQESIDNLKVMREIARDSCNPKWVWITPYFINEEKQDANAWYKQMQLRWHNPDLQPLIDFMLAQQNDIVLNLQEKFAQSEVNDFLAYDGIHLSMNGYKQVVKGLVNKLANPSKQD